MSQGEHLPNLRLAADPQTYQAFVVADKLEQVQRFLWQEAGKRRHSMMMGNPPYPNASRLAKALEVEDSTIWRLVWAKRRIKTTEDRKRPLREYSMTQELRQALCNWLDMTPGDLEDALEHADPLPDHPKLRARRRSK